MGLMDKLKSVKNAVTGGAATVSVQIPEGKRGQPVTMQISATAKANLSAKKVYVLVRAIEEAVVEDYDTGRGRETVRGTHTAHELKVDVAGQTEMKEGESQTWETTVNLPATGGATYHGRTIRYLWQAQAGLDTVGNDPDSGWVEFQVQ